MPVLGRFTRELRARLWKPSVADEVSRELDYHLEMLEQEFRAQGLDAVAAREAARRKFGDSGRIGDACRDIGAQRDRERQRSEWLGDLGQDARYAVRQLRGNPRFTVVAVLTLAVGLGAVTTIFGIANAVLLRPLPFAQPDRLVQAMETTPVGADFSVSEPDYHDWKERARSFEDVGAFSRRTPTLRTETGAERLDGTAVTHSLFTTLGIRPALGRTFLREEDVIGGDTRVVVLSHALWQRRFGSDPGAVGRSIELDGSTHRVIGVMPPGFDFPNRSEIWVPLVPTSRYPRGDRRLEVVARVGPNTTVDQAAAELSAIARDIAATYPASNTGWGARVQPLRESFVTPQLEARVVALLATVGVLLAMACVNVASLLLARSGAREREIAVRAALGAGRARIVRQLVVESLVLALFGASIGVALASVAIPIVRGIGGDAIPRLAEMTLDWRVLGFALAACVVTGVVFGLAPAVALVRSGRGAGAGALALLRGGARTTGGAGLRNGLVVTSVSLAMLLLVCAGLVGTSFVKLMRVDVGFDAEHVLTASVALPVSLYPADTTPGRYSRERVVQFHDALIERLERTPGVRAAAATNIAPFSGENTGMGFEPVGAASGRPDEYRQASWRVVTPNFFSVMSIPLVRGRVFDTRDRYPAPDAMVINETMARLGWSGEDPVGQQVKLKSGRTMTVVGVVADTRHLFVDSLPAPTMYFSHAQFPWPTMWVTVRAAGDPAALSAALRREVSSLDPNVAAARIQPLGRLVREATAEPRLIVVVFGIFASAALVLATIGLYGIVSYTVSQRSREIGVRLALGAPPGQIVRTVLGHGVRLAAIGVALGIAGAYATGGVLRSILFQTAPTDAVTCLAIGIALIAIAGVASAGPARRAARVDPIITLRTE